jgi:Flp pilus assembly protein TadG
MTMTTLRFAFFKDNSGTTAIEFAIVAPVFLGLLVGMLYLCLALFSASSLHYAVEEGARCASVKTTICTSPLTTVAYAQNAYYGAAISPTFNYSTAACGKQVTGTANFTANLMLTTVTIPMSASACFP